MTTYPLSALFPRRLSIRKIHQAPHASVPLPRADTRLPPPRENPELQASAQLTVEESPPSALRLKYKQGGASV